MLPELAYAAVAVAPLVLVRFHRRSPQPVASSGATEAYGADLATMRKRLRVDTRLVADPPEPGTDQWWTDRLAALERIQPLRARVAWRRLDSAIGADWADLIAQQAAVVEAEREEHEREWQETTTFWELVGPLVERAEWALA